MTQRRLWQAAASLAARSHRYGVRKDQVTPYVAHPVRVTLTVATLFGHVDDVTLAAALLHDVIEDCDVDYDDVQKHVGREVADIVAALTKDMRLPEPHREPAYDRQLADGPWQARLIKLADVYDNLIDAIDHDARRKVLPKAERAVELARGDVRLDKARRIVEGLMDQFSDV